MLRLKMSLLVAIFAFAHTSLALEENDVVTFQQALLADISDLSGEITVLNQDGSPADISTTAFFSNPENTDATIRFRLNATDGVISHSAILGEDGSLTSNLQYHTAEGNYVCGSQTVYHAEMDANRAQEASILSAGNLDSCVTALAKKTNAKYKRMPAGLISLAVTVVAIGSSSGFLYSELHKKVKGRYPFAKGKSTALVPANQSKGLRRVNGLLRVNNSLWNNSVLGKGFTLRKGGAAGLLLAAYIIF